MKKSRQLRSIFQIRLKVQDPHVTCLDVTPSTHTAEVFSLWKVWMTWLVISKLATIRFCPRKNPKSQIRTKNYIGQTPSRKCNPPEPLLSHSPTRLWSEKNLQKMTQIVCLIIPLVPLYTHPLDPSLLNTGLLRYWSKRNDPKPPISMLNTWFPPGPSNVVPWEWGQLSPTPQAMKQSCGSWSGSFNMDSNQMILTIPLKQICASRSLMLNPLSDIWFLLDKSFGVLKLIGAETDWTVMCPNGDNFQNT